MGKNNTSSKPRKAAVCGIDLGSRYSEICVLDADGAVLERGRLAARQQADASGSVSGCLALVYSLWFADGGDAGAGGDAVEDGVAGDESAEVCVAGVGEE